LFEAALNGTPFPLFGGGEQVRDFTFVNDVVRANLAAADADVEPGAVFNIAGGGECSMHEHIALVEEITGRSIKIDDRPSERGDVRRTGGSTEAAAKWLEWTPEVDLRNGLEAQYEWHMGRRK
jgi:nucleoside-diphosphate-sugar epimerase